MRNLKLKCLEVDLESNENGWVMAKLSEMLKSERTALNNVF